MVTTCISLYQDYFSCCQHGRIREVTEIEARNERSMMQNDFKEAQAVRTLFLKAILQTAKSLESETLEGFDAVTGDHTCQVLAAVVIDAFFNQSLKKEAQDLIPLVEHLLKTKMQISQQSVSPMDLLQSDPSSLMLSTEMAELVRAYFLCLGKELSIGRNGRVTVVLNLRTVAQKLGCKDFYPYVTKIIDSARSQMNLDTIKRIQKIASCVLNKEEQLCLSDVYVQEGRGSFMNNLLRFSCAFYAVKGPLLYLAKKRIPFCLEVYEEKKKGPLMQFFFQCNGEEKEGIPIMERVPTISGPFLRVQAYFPEDPNEHEMCVQKIAAYGLLPFLFAQGAQGPQFKDVPLEGREAFLRDRKDIECLPQEQREEISRYREMGQVVAREIPCTVIHMLASTTNSSSST